MSPFLQIPVVFLGLAIFLAGIYLSGRRKAPMMGPEAQEWYDKGYSSGVTDGYQQRSLQIGAETSSARGQMGD